MGSPGRFRFVECLSVEDFLGANCSPTFAYALIRTVWQQPIGFDIISEVGFEHFDQSPAQVGGGNGKEKFEPLAQIPAHPVSAAEIDLLMPSIAKVEDPRMLEKAIDDRCDFDVLGEFVDARP